MHSRSTVIREPVVITGLGLVTANGFGREAVWNATRAGNTGIVAVGESDFPFRHSLQLAAKIDVPAMVPNQLKTVQLARLAADEAVYDAKIDFDAVDRDRFACAVSAHVGDITWWNAKIAPDSEFGGSRFQEQQWLPNSTCWDLATRFGLCGPRFAHSTACASGLIDILTAVRSIRDGQADIALAGSSESIDPVFAAGFHRMKVLASGATPATSCLPFDERRHGFVMGEGAGIFVIERLGHALARGAKIYAEIVTGKVLADAHHVTSLDVQSDALEHLIRDCLRKADIGAADVGYVNAHGTGTEQNDLIEATGIRAAFQTAADDVCVSSLKSMLGHLVNASGSVELGLTVLGMRDGFAPPTINLERRDPRCDLDFVPFHARAHRFQHAMKLSLAFGGHLVAAIVRRWNDAQSGFGYPAPDRIAA